MWGFTAPASGIGFMIPQMSTGTYNSTVNDTTLGFIWGGMGQEEPWGDTGEGTIPAPATIAHVSEEFSGS